MKVRISYIVEIENETRSAMGEYGCLETDDEGRATRKAVKDWYENHGRSMDLDLAEMCGNADENGWTHSHGDDW